MNGKEKLLLCEEGGSINEQQKSPNRSAASLYVSPSISSPFQSNEKYIYVRRRLLLQSILISTVWYNGQDCESYGQ